jgi:hypothetical protein
VIRGRLGHDSPPIVYAICGNNGLQGDRFPPERMLADRNSDRRSAVPDRYLQFADRSGSRPRMTAAYEPFTFGIALMGRASARDWALVEGLLDLSLTSIRAQTDQDFRVVIAAHDLPRLRAHEPRLTFLHVDWPTRESEPCNADGGRKKRVIEDFVLANGGGLLMLLDADDWVDVHLVEAARATIGSDQVGALIDGGLVTDLQSLRAAPVPHPAVFAREFHRICGSSSVARLQPEAVDQLRRNPCRVFDSHHQWVEVAREHRAVLARLPVSGNYLINTSENHSEVHGPYAAWRQTFKRSVNREGGPLDERLASRFGLGLDQIRAASERAKVRARERAQKVLP